MKCPPYTCRLGKPSCWAKNKQGCNERAKFMKKIATGQYPMPINETLLQGMDTKERQVMGAQLLLLLAQAADEAIANGGVWVSFGTTKKVDALVLTVHQKEGSTS